MKKKIQQVMVFALVLGFIMSTKVYAAIVTKTITLPIDTWVSNKETKISDVQFSLARCNAVYPTGTYTEDNYHRIRVRIKSGGNIVSKPSGGNSYYTLTEGQDNTRIDYSTRLVAGTEINIQFKGNDPEKAAKADVLYTAN